MQVDIEISKFDHINLRLMCTGQYQNTDIVDSKGNYTHFTHTDTHTPKGTKGWFLPAKKRQGKAH